MDSTETKISSDDEIGQNDDSELKSKGKRLRIKDTRKVDYNRMPPSSRPFQPTYGQTRQTSSFPQRGYSPQDGDSASPRQPRMNESYQEDNRYPSDEGSGYQRRSFRPHEQGGYQQRSYGNQSGGYQSQRPYDNSQGGGYQQQRSYGHTPNSGYQQQRSFDNAQGGGYQQRRSFNNPETGYPEKKSYGAQGAGRPGGYQQRNYNQNSGYQQSGGYNQGGGYQQSGGYNQGGGYNQQSGYSKPGGYNQQGGPSPRGGNYQRGGYNQGGGYNSGPNQFRKPGGVSNGRKPMQGYQSYPSKQTMPRPVKYQEIVSDMSAPIRLNKYLANAGVCSRREADEFIQAGVVKVNGEVITELGTKITRLDKVLFHDQPVQIESKIYILLNKPKNCVTTSDDPQNRQNVMDLVKNACQERIYPVGRLDRNTTGVLLLTNDGEMAAKLTHPSFKKKKIYHVWLDREVTIEDMEKLATGIELEDGEIHADAISYANDNDKSQVGIEIHSGKNRVVRRMFEMLDYHVIKLDRVYFAGLTKKNLGRGKWRYLSEQEVNALRMGAYE